LHACVRIRVGIHECRKDSGLAKTVEDLIERVAELEVRVATLEE